MQRLNKGLAWIGFAWMITLPVMAQQKSEFSLEQATSYALKNSVAVKKALVDVKIQNETNREITASAYPNISGSLSSNYFPNVAVQSFPNFISAATYGVLEQEGVKNGNGQPIISPTDFGFCTGPVWNQIHSQRRNKRLATIIRRSGIYWPEGPRRGDEICQPAGSCN
jgi:outer membrane protein